MFNQVKLGDVFWVDFQDQDSENPKGIRPAVVIQNNKGNWFSQQLIVLPLSTVLKRPDLLFHVFIPQGILDKHRASIVLCESPTCISKNQICSYMGHLPDSYMSKVAAGSLFATGLLSCLDDREIKEVKVISNFYNRYTGELTPI